MIPGYVWAWAMRGPKDVHSDRVKKLDHQRANAQATLNAARKLK